MKQRGIEAIGRQPQAAMIERIFVKTLIGSLALVAVAFGSLAFLALTCAVLAADKPTPTDESRALAQKQIDSEITDLKVALEGLRTSVEKGDKDSFSLYRSQARSALAELDKLAAAAIGAASKTERNALREGKMEPSPTATAARTATPEASPEIIATPSATASPSASATPTP
jgi:hypothetical protein